LYILKNPFMGGKGRECWLHFSYNYVMSFNLVVIIYVCTLWDGGWAYFQWLVVTGEKLIIHDLIVVDDGLGFFQFVEIM
jgi:hypothetical protein